MPFKRPYIFGVVNVTEDSFSDGGRYLDSEQAIQHALQLAKDGADVIDLGPQASSPIAKVVTSELEISRLTPIIKVLQEHQIAISVDSYHPETQRFCLQQQIAVLNDIQGFPYPELYAELANSNCSLVLMHSIQQFGIAQEIATTTEQLLDNIETFFFERISALTKAGVKREQIILDPGMGFFLGSNIDASTTVLNNITRLKQRFNLPIFISVSRKSFLRNITHRAVDEVQAATLCAEIYAILQGADYIRTHDVKALNDACNVLEALS